MARFVCLLVALLLLRATQHADAKKSASETMPHGPPPEEDMSYK